MHWHQSDFGTHHYCTPCKPTRQTLMIPFPLRSQCMCSVPCLVDACLLCNQHNLLHLKYACLLDTKSMRLNLEQMSARLYRVYTLSAALSLKTYFQGSWSIPRVRCCLHDQISLEYRANCEEKNGGKKRRRKNKEKEKKKKKKKKKKRKKRTRQKSISKHN